VHRPLAAGLVTLVLLVPGCGDDGGEATDATPPPADTARTVPTRLAVTPLTVSLEAPGQAPRSPLRQDLRPGPSGTADLEFALAVEGVNSARVSGDAGLEVTDVADVGRATVDYGLTGLDVSVSAGSAAEGEPVTDALDITGVLEVGPARDVSTASVETTNTGEIPGVEAVAGSLDPRMAFLLLPFPSEPVGVGARWTVEGPLPLFGTTVTLVADVRLEERRQGRYTVTAGVAMETSEGGSGPEIALLGTGRLAGDVSRLGLRQGTIGLDGTVVLPDRGPDPRPMTLELDVRAR